MVNRVVSTKLSEEEHSRLVDFCNSKGCTPSSLIKEVILGKISPKEEPKETEIPEKKNESEKKLFVGIVKSSDILPPQTERPKPTLEETLDHIKNCKNPDCKYGRTNILKNLQ